jgi:hypothetical protein
VTAAAACPRVFALNLSALPEVAAAVADAAANKTNATGNGGPVKARFLTPFNRLVGALVVSQRRAAAAACASIQNSRVLAYSAAATGVKCRAGGGGGDNRAFGRDPAFTPMSRLYDGNLDPADFYGPAERAPGPAGEPGAGTPLGFFPRGYSGSAGVGAAAGVPAGEAGVFKLYFDERLQARERGGSGSFAGGGGGCE